MCIMPMGVNYCSYGFQEHFYVEEQHSGIPAVQAVGSFLQGYLQLRDI